MVGHSSDGGDLAGFGPSTNVVTPRGWSAARSDVSQRGPSVHLLNARLVTADGPVVLLKPAFGFWLQGWTETIVRFIRSAHLALPFVSTPFSAASILKAGFHALLTVTKSERSVRSLSHTKRECWREVTCVVEFFWH